jgi:molybdopterin adenylyltransferase
VRDDVNALVRRFQIWIADASVDAIVTTGGAGVTGRDVTPEAVRAVIDRMIPGFDELFRWISFRKIRTSTIQSRALAGSA